MKKLICIITLLFSVCLISACSCDINREANYEPKPDEYIEWDGNYFYYENFRCTTDLCVEEPYITEVTYDENVYSIDSVYHSVFGGDKLHMTFETQVASDEEPRVCYAYMIYSLESQQVEFLYLQEFTEPIYNNDLYKIVGVGNNYAVFQGNGKISKLDLTSSKMEFVNCISYEVKHGYAVVMYDNKLFASDLDAFDFKPIMSITNSNSKPDYFIQSIDGRILLQITDQSTAVVDDKSVGVSSLTYYDFEGDTFYELVKFQDSKLLSIDTKNTSTFILGEPKWIGYNGYTSGDEHLEYKLLVDNNILYTVTFDESRGVEIKELYAFEKGKEYKINQFENNIIHLNKKTPNKPVSHKYYNRIDSSREYFDLDKMKILDKEEHDYNNRITIAEYGDVVYYIETKVVTGFMAGSTVHYYLYRFDKTTKQKGLLKYFVNHIEGMEFDNYIINNKKYDFNILVRGS